MTSSRCATAVALAVVTLGAWLLRPAYAAAGCSSAQLAMALAAIDAGCACTNSGGHRAYVQCAKSAIPPNLEECRGQATQCASKSTCGTGRKKCCRADATGKTKCSIKGPSAECAAPKGGTALRGNGSCCGGGRTGSAFTGCNCAVLCDDHNPCTQDACDPVTRRCSHQALTDGTPCNDAPSFCTSGECSVCVPSEATVPRFVDNGNGTVTDRKTCLVWEKKTAGLHHVNNVYAWAGCCNGDCSTAANYCQPNAAAAATCAAHAEGGTQGCSMCASGTCTAYSDDFGALTTAWDWLSQVNAENYAGHSDWRLPSENGCNSCYTYFSCPCTPGELETILLAPYGQEPPGQVGCGYNDEPCIDPIFGRTQMEWPYWSASPAGPGGAWGVYFSGGAVVHHTLAGEGYVRAVR